MVSLVLRDTEKDRDSVSQRPMRRLCWLQPTPETLQLVGVAGGTTMVGLKRNIPANITLDTDILG